MEKKNYSKLKAVLSFKEILLLDQKENKGIENSIFKKNGFLFLM